jgi:hypothetical protein
VGAFIQVFDVCACGRRDRGATRYCGQPRRKGRRYSPSPVTVTVAVTDRPSGRAPARTLAHPRRRRAARQELVTTRYSWTALCELKILVSAVQSRPCPPLLRAGIPDNQPVTRPFCFSSSASFRAVLASSGTRVVQDASPVLTSRDGLLETAPETAVEIGAKRRSIPSQGVTPAGATAARCLTKRPGQIPTWSAPHFDCHPGDVRCGGRPHGRAPAEGGRQAGLQHRL